MTQAQKSLLCDVFVLKANINVLNESDDKQGLPPGVLARVHTPIAMIEGVSLNNRYYYPELWEEHFPEIQERFGKMFGTLGHDTELDETAIRGGDITHKVVRMWPDKKSGLIMGEIHIIDTDGGHNLNTLMRQGFEMGVSTRAYGDVERGKGPNGSDKIMLENFFLETVDFVCTPGVTATKKAAIVESTKPTKLTEDSQVGMEQLLESYQKDSAAKQLELHEANTKLRDSQSLNENLTKEIQEYKALFGSINEAKQLHEGLRKWSEMEPFRSLAGRTGLFAQPNIGGPEFVDKTMKLTEQYCELGTPSEIKEAQALLEQYKEHGSIKATAHGKALLEGYMKATGNRRPEQVKKLLENAAKIVGIYHDVRTRRAARKLHGHFVKKLPNLTESWVIDMLQDVPAKKVFESLKKLSESAPANANGKMTPNGKPRSVATKPTQPRVDEKARGGTEGSHKAVMEMFSGQVEPEKTVSIFEKFKSDPRRPKQAQ